MVRGSHQAEACVCGVFLTCKVVVTVWIASSIAPDSVCSSIQGYIAWIAVIELPSLSRYKITSMGVRVPMITGSPPIICGSDVMNGVIAALILASKWKKVKKKSSIAFPGQSHLEQPVSTDREAPENDLFLEE